MVAHNNDLDPQDLHPGLLPDRLTSVASLLAGTLIRAYRDHRPEVGESNWSLGTRYCERRISALTRAGEEWGWLGVLDASRRFIFTIDGFPLRVATGRGHRLRRSMRRIDEDELCAHQLALFGYEEDDTGYVWRLIVDVRAGWAEPRVTLVQAWPDSGEARRSWRIPLDGVQVRRWIDEELAPPHEVDPLDLGWLDEEQDDDLDEARG